MTKRLLWVAPFIIVLFMLSACDVVFDGFVTSEDSHNDITQTDELETSYTPYLPITEKDHERLEEYYSDRDITAVKVYAYGAISSEPFSKIVEKDIENALCYVIWESPENLVSKLWVHNGSSSLNNYSYTVENSPFRDFALVNSTVNILDTECFLYEVVCLDGSLMQMPTINYLITDRGVFVKYYSISKTQMLTFTEDEYRTLAAAYDNFCQETMEGRGNQEEDGLPINLEFHDFVENEALLEKYGEP